MNNIEIGKPISKQLSEALLSQLTGDDFRAIGAKCGYSWLNVGNIARRSWEVTLKRKPALIEMVDLAIFKANKAGKALMDFKKDVK